jgi:hypothetical protein
MDKFISKKGEFDFLEFRLALLSMYEMLIALESSISNGDEEELTNISYCDAWVSFTLKLLAGKQENMICVVLHKILNKFLDDKLSTGTYFYQMLDDKTIRFFLPAREESLHDLDTFLFELYGTKQQPEVEGEKDI